MAIKRRRRIQATPLTWSAGGTFNLDMSFLDKAAGMRNPEVVKLYAYISASVTTANDGTTFNGEDHSRFLANLTWSDETGQRIPTFTGPELRLAEQQEHGNSILDPAQVAANTTATVVKVFRLLLPSRRNTARKRDFSIPVAELRKSVIQGTWCAAAIVSSVTVNSGTLTFWAEVQENTEPETKSRIVLKRQPIVNADYNYPVNGTLRWAVGSAPQAVGTAGYQAWTSVTDLTSQTLDLIAIPRQLLVESYADDTGPQYGSTTPSSCQDEVFTGYAFPIAWAERGQKTLDGLELNSLHLKFGAAVPTGANLLYSVVEDRNPEVAAQQLGFGSASEAIKSLNSSGYVKQAPGGNATKRARAGYDGRSLKRLPQRVGR